MGDRVQHAWGDLADRVNALGATIRERYREAGDEREADAVRSALDQLVAAGRQLGDRVGEVAHDDEVRTRAKAAADSLDEALRITVDLIATEIEGLFRPSGGAPPDDAPPSGELDRPNDG